MSTILLFLFVIFIFFMLSSGVSKRPRRQYQSRDIEFSEAKYLVGLLAKVAKSDGRVNKLEANLISEILDDLTAKIGGSNTQREELRRVYNNEKDNLKNVFKMAFEYKTRFNLDLKTAVGRVYFFLNIAYIDGVFTSEERRVISQICDGFEIPSYLQDEIFARFERDFKARNYQRYQNRNYQEQNYQNHARTQPGKKNPYDVLGLKDGASFDEIRTSYRALVKKYHPDILMGKGADDEIIKAGTKKLQEINEAYEALKAKFGK
ncbi:DnaJ domain-containing protein [Campylobacter geochelonis]|uniref:DnaJ domain-containing protein n=1 Tax=Campylobacter geochelonis TaxID=1780362 RepID=A0A128EL31_9BACT|nr:DnaJ domain-containing protein [Campylobacter geochelonis]QKF71536.1 DnaJ-like membrane chaperone protein [Campylobacter geochelonis]CZE48799.1 DnaJ domain-containing protein [Campylobacter geochelonis]CZE49068.1 DnaJ domain-containing protein [Campylobacter geochelonis]CZE51363.1 DnaJ domain-containing protein [Campylobacter geochelonis]